MGEKAFEAWGIVDLFGHQRLAGRITEQEVGGCSFVRLDVPETATAQAFTRLLGQKAIYSITLTTEETARAMAAQCAPKPVDVWDVRKIVAQLPSLAEVDTEDEY